MNIRLICMDLDGTALLADHNSFSPRLEAALSRACEKGVKIVPVTGRQFGLLPPPLKVCPAWAELTVVCNGGQLRRLSTAEILSRLEFQPQALRQILSLTEKHDLPVELSVDSILHLTERSLALEEWDPNLLFHRDVILKTNGRIMDSLDSVCDMAVEKVNLVCIPEEIREEVVRELEGIDVTVAQTGGHTMEITPPGASKGNALLALCDLLNISPENTMALGDSGNDITMLRAAGLGVAMGNAPDAVKVEADVVTETNLNDGAAIAIEKYVLA